MSPLLTVIVAAALFGLIALSVFVFIKQRSLRPFLLQIVLLAGLAFLLHQFFGFPTPRLASVSKSLGSDELPIIGVLFACMLIGMLAHWLYVWLETPQGTRPPFDLGPFIAPILASPIVFVPLLASLQNADLDLSQFDIPRFMVFLVAFENGFLTPTGTLLA